MSWWNKTEEEEQLQTMSEVSNPPLEESHEPAMTTSGKDIYDKRYGSVRSALGEGTVIQGKLSFDTPVKIDGNLSGEVFSSSTLIVGAAGKVSATVNVDTLVVLGSVSGDITARKRLEIHESGEVAGDITTPSLFIEEGAYFEGKCLMEASAANSEASQEKKESSKDKKESQAKDSSVKVPIVQRAKNDSKVDEKKANEEAKEEASSSDKAIVETRLH